MSELKWIESENADFNTIFKAQSMRESGGKACFWRITPTIRNDEIVWWIDESDQPLKGFECPGQTFQRPERAKAFCAASERAIAKGG